MSALRRVHKLTTGELVIGESEGQGDFVIVQAPYSIYETSTGQMAVMPYEYPYLVEPMKDITLRAFDIMWSKRLDEFPQVETQYIEATTGVKLEDKSIIL